MKRLSYLEKIQWILDALEMKGEKKSSEAKHLKERNLLIVLMLLFGYFSAVLIAVAGVCYLGFGSNSIAWAAILVLSIWGAFSGLNRSFTWVVKTHGRMAQKFPQLYAYYWKKYHVELGQSTRDENLAASREMGKQWTKNGFAWMVSSEKLGQPAKLHGNKPASVKKPSKSKSEPKPIPVSGTSVFSQSTAMSITQENRAKTHFSQKPAFQTVLYVLLIAVAVLYLVEKLGSLLPLAAALLIVAIVLVGMAWSIKLVYKRSKHKVQGVLSVLLLLGIFALVLGIYVPTLVNKSADRLGLNNLSGMLPAGLFNASFSGSSSGEVTLVPTQTVKSPMPRVMVPAPMKYTEEQKLLFMEQGKSELEVASKALNDNFQVLTDAAGSLSEEQNLVSWPEYESALFPRFAELKLWATEGFTNTENVWVSPSLCLRLQLGEEMEALPSGTSQQLSPVCQYYVGALEATKGMISSLSEVYKYAEDSGWVYEKIQKQHGEEVEKAFLQARAYESVAEENLAVLNTLQAAAGIPEISMYTAPDGRGYVDYMEYFYNNPPEEVVKITATPAPTTKAMDYLPVLQNTPTATATAGPPTATSIPPTPTKTPSPTLIPQVPCSPASVSEYEFAGRDPHVDEPSLWHITGNFYDSSNQVGRVVEYSEECGGWILLFHSDVMGDDYWDLITWMPYVDSGTYLKMIDDPAYPWHVKFVYSDQDGNEYGDFLKEDPPATPTPAAIPPDSSSYECQTALAGIEPDYHEDPSYSPPGEQDWKWLILRTNMDQARAYYTYCGEGIYWVAVYQYGLDGEKDWYWTHVVPPGTTEQDLWWPVQMVFPCNFGQDIQTCVDVEIRGQR